MKIDLHYGMDPSFGPASHEERGVGGTENFITYASEYLAAKHDVRVYNKIIVPTIVSDSEKPDRKWEWLPLKRFDPVEPRDVLVSFRVRDVFEAHPMPATRLKVLILADTESYGLGDAVRAGKVNLVMAVGEWQATKIMREEGLDKDQVMITSNGVSMRRFEETGALYPSRKLGKCVHLSTPERGLMPLLNLWPAIQDSAAHASLHLFSSFKGWGVSDEDDEAMSGSFYERIETLRSVGYNIINHKHVNAREMRKQLLTSQLMLYPTVEFNETCCISAIEASAAGVPIVATARAALRERVRHGRTGYLIEQDESHDKYFIEHTTRLLHDLGVWNARSLASIEMATEYDYGVLVERWADRWADEVGL